MTGPDLKTARCSSRWTQAEAAQRLGVTQAYLSMVERGARPVSDQLAATALKVYSLPPTARPVGLKPKRQDSFLFKEALGELGYPGFSYLHGRRAMNPAELLLLALDSDELDSRVTEALPWLPLQFPELDWDWLVSEAKLRDRQNRLAFVTELALEIMQTKEGAASKTALQHQLDRLERSRLAVEDTLCKASMSQAERTWLRSHRTRRAAHWNLLTDLKVEDLAYAA